MTDHDALVAMGFEPDMVAKALRATKNSGLQPALDYLVNGGADEDNNAQGSTLGGGDAVNSGSNNDADINATGNNIVDDEDVVGGGGSSDVGATTPPPQRELTAQEKMERAERLQRRLAERRKEKEEQERRDRLENEKLRRQTGQELAMARDAAARREMAEIAAERKRQKNEDREILLRLRAQIDAEKEARRKEAEAARLARAAATSGTVSTEAAAVAAKPDVGSGTGVAKATKSAVSDRGREARILVRSAGQVVLSGTFPGDMKVRELYDKVAQAGGRGMLSQTFPRRQLDGPIMDQTLWEAGLVPSAALLLQ